MRCPGQRIESVHPGIFFMNDDFVNSVMKDVMNGLKKIAPEQTVDHMKKSHPEWFDIAEVKTNTESQ